MTDFTIFMLLSIMECSAMFYLMFKIFKIDLYLKEVLFSGLVMSFISFVIRQEYALPQLDVAVQITLMFLFTWLLFKTHVFYASIMVIMTYQAYMLIQTFLFFLMQFIDVKWINIYFLQIISAVITVAIAKYVSKKRRGFDFVPDTPTSKIKVEVREKILFTLMIPSLFLLLTTMYITEHLPHIYALIPIIYGCILFGYIFISYKKDMTEYE